MLKISMILCVLFLLGCRLEPAGGVEDLVRLCAIYNGDSTPLITYLGSTNALSTPEPNICYNGLGLLHHPLLWYHYLAQHSALPP